MVLSFKLFVFDRDTSVLYTLVRVHGCCGITAAPDLILARLFQTHTTSSSCCSTLTPPSCRPRCLRSAATTNTPGRAEAQRSTAQSPCK